MPPKFFPEIGVQIPEIWLPAPSLDLPRWAVIACDQFTSEPEYWHKVEDWVGNAPSTLNLVLPETYLDEPRSEAQIQRIHQNMDEFMRQGLLQPHHGMVYVERTLSNNVTRRGLLLALDLEHYDYQKNGIGLIRATEGTILDRLPPRIQVRHGSTLELPHILVLIDDPCGWVHEPVTQARDRLKPLYDFELPFGSGHLSGWLVDQEDVEMSVIQSLHRLAHFGSYTDRFGNGKETNGMLFAVGDGNHSFAAAKAYWDQIKNRPGIGCDHPARFALVELVNLQDGSIHFEPIHRVLFGLRTDPILALKAYFGERIQLFPCQGIDPLSEMVSQVDHSAKLGHALGVITPGCILVAHIEHPEANLPVGTLQPWLDSIIGEGNAKRIDYVHGVDVLSRLGSQPENAGFYLPPLPKEELYRTVILDGALPRKTFSMGTAQDKRFYMESRKIVP